MARAQGARVIACASSGNAGAAAAAYAARAGLPCVVFALREAPAAMLAQIRACGAMTVATATPADRWTLLAGAAQRYGWFATSPSSDPPLGSNPYGLEGYKTIAYEIAEALDWQAPDWCALPVCYGDALFGLWKGFDEMLALGWIAKRPRLIAAEIAGSLQAAMAQGLDMPPRIGTNRASIALSIDAPRSTFQALQALRRSDGIAVKVGDEEIESWRARLAAEEGLFAEAASAAPFAAIARLRDAGTIAAGDTVVAVMTASGLKDAPRSAPDDVPLVAPDPEALREALARRYGFHV
jgi:threonine synthase